MAPPAPAELEVVDSVLPAERNVITVDKELNPERQARVFSAARAVWPSSKVYVLNGKTVSIW